MHKIQKKFFVSDLNASKFVALNSLYQEDNTCHQQSMYVNKQS